MYFITERIGKIAEELSRYIYSNKIRIENFLFKEGNYKSIQEAETNNNWNQFTIKHRWGGKDKNFWFKTEFKCPKEFEGKEIAIIVYTNMNGWDAINPQFLAYVDGKLIQAVDVNHREILLGSNYKESDVIRLDLHAYSGMIDKELELFVEFAIFNRDVFDLFYDLWVPLKACNLMPNDSLDKQGIINALNNAINIIDLRKPFSVDFFKSCKKAREYLSSELYDKFSSYEDIVATCIGHTHIDVAWQWTHEQSRQKAIRSFLTVLKLMEEYPDYLFMSSQPQLYKFVKEDYPEVYKRIKEKIKEGKWEAEGAMWLEADCNLTSGESLVRQILFGKRFFKDEFGIDNKVLWLPDVFGYSAALPQILKKSGVDYFMTTKISWNQFNKLPYDTFMWRGIDGTEVLTHFVTTKDYKASGHFTTYNGEINPSQIAGAWERYQQKNINNDVLVCFGYGDGGGGPTRSMLENAKRLKNGFGFCPKVKMGKVLDYFERLDKKVQGNKYLPKWVGELYLEYHRGTYTSMARNKKFNRKSEFAYTDAEFLSSVAKELGFNYPQQELNNGWETILLNQFHDILPGSSIKEVYDVSKKEYEQVLKKADEIKINAAKLIASNIETKDKSLVVFNTLSFECSQTVEFDYETDKEVYLVDSKDKKYLCKRISKNKFVALLDKLPPKGYKTFNIIETNELFQTHKDLVVENNRLENKYFIILINERGEIESIYDKRADREVLKKGKTANRLVAFEDKPMNFDNWDIDIYYTEKSWDVNQVEKVEVVETDNIRGILRIYKTFSDSKIIQDIIIYQDIPRIDFKTYVDWKENQVLLKTFFPVDVNTSKATFEIQYGNVERPTHFNTLWDVARFESVAHKWVDVSQEDYGASLLNDCKYGHSVHDNEIGLTLIKSGIEPNREADREEHYFTYSFYPHEGDWKIAKTHLMAYSLNVPPVVIVEEPHKGILPKEMSFIEISENNVILEVVKKAEDSEDLILRAYECYNKQTKVSFKLWTDIEWVSECDLLENEIEKISSQGNTFEIIFKPYEIKTFKIRLQK
ncbi:alpha-mannosidase [Caldicellulosiruptoraceae bacterium PP1]